LISPPRRSAAFRSCTPSGRNADAVAALNVGGAAAECDHFDGERRTKGHAFLHKPNSVLTSDIVALPTARRQINFRGSQKASKVAYRAQYRATSRTPRCWRRWKRSPMQRTVRCVGACERTRGLRSCRQWITVRWLVSQAKWMTLRRVISKE
jgi:hypothetical protein